VFLLAFVPETNQSSAVREAASAAKCARLLFRAVKDRSTRRKMGNVLGTIRSRGILVARETKISSRGRIVTLSYEAAQGILGRIREERNGG